MPNPRTRPGDDVLANWECEARKYNVTALEEVPDDPMQLLYLVNLDSAAQEHWMRRHRRFSGIPEKTVVRKEHDQVAVKHISRLRQRPADKHTLFGCDCDNSSKDAKPVAQTRTAHFNTDPVSDVQLIPSRKRQREEQAEEEQKTTVAETAQHAQHAQPPTRFRQTAARRRRIETPKSETYTKNDGDGK